MPLIRRGSSKVEQRTHKPLVAGSSPALATNNLLFLPSGLSRFTLNSPLIFFDFRNVQKFYEWLEVAISRHEAAQLRQTSAHCCIIGSSVNFSQSSAQRSQTSAQTPQVRPWRSDIRSIKLALVWQISAQSNSSRI